MKIWYFMFNANTLSQNNHSSFITSFRKKGLDSGVELLQMEIRLSKEVKDVFQNLLDMEKHEEVEIVRNAARLQGI